MQEVSPHPFSGVNMQWTDAPPGGSTAEHPVRSRRPTHLRLKFQEERERKKYILYTRKKNK